VKTEVRAYLSAIGRRGGRKSRRTLAPETARDMVRLRDARRAYRLFHTQCFWSYDPAYRVTLRDVPWVVEQLMKFGGRTGWDTGARLCR
jgi:hypothetical protein